MIAAAALPVPADLAARVSPESYARLLGYPTGEVASGQVTRLAEASRDWFRDHARPWAYAATLGSIEISEATVTLVGGRRLRSARLATRLAEVDATELVAAVVSAGGEVDRASSEHWAGDRPDQAYFLDRFGAAVAIHLGAWAAEHLRDRVAAAGRGLAPGYSPGYDGWELSDQVEVAQSLLEVAPEGRRSLPGELRVHDSGMLEPKSSLLAVFGLARPGEELDRQWARQPCSWCSLSGCTLRSGHSPSPAGRT